MHGESASSMLVAHHQGSQLHFNYYITLHSQVILLIGESIQLFEVPIQGEKKNDWSMNYVCFSLWQVFLMYILDPCMYIDIVCQSWVAI